MKQGFNDVRFPKKGITPKAKAEELVSKIFNTQHVDDRAKMICLSTVKIAIICVEEIIKSLSSIMPIGLVSPYQKYWTEVLTELKAME